MNRGITVLFLLVSMHAFSQKMSPAKNMHLNSMDYLEYQGVNVMLAHDFYPEGHQGGVGVIQNGQRVATNGDIRLEPTPGQWQPIPKVGERKVDRLRQTVSVHMEYPNEAINRKGFNPIIYPDLHFSYTVRVEPAGKGFRIVVDLDSTLPESWIGKVGFNFELFPGSLFGKSYYLDGQTGIFPRQANGPQYKDREGETQIMAMATGRKLTVAPESAAQRMTIENLHGELQLLDGRGKHNNGWFVVRSLIATGARKNAVEWLVTPHAIQGWRSSPVVQVSQVGYHPNQEKIAVIELDKNDLQNRKIKLMRVGEDGSRQEILEVTPKFWGNFLRYRYLRFDFSPIKKNGIYQIAYGGDTTVPFLISDSVFARNVWQPTLEYFLPAQMCHMRVNEKYRVWHGYCHLDDARMAPIDSNHFDGYLQGPSTLTKYQPGQTVPGLNAGGWHDAGDYDMRVESQAGTVYGLTLAYEAFHPGYDNTSIDQQTKIVEIGEPDGKPDILQQVEHGLLTLINSYNSLGRFYRGIIEPTLRQYTVLGDPANITDNIYFRSNDTAGKPAPVGQPGSPDDRWVFTEENPGRALEAAAALAAASRVMNGFNDTLAQSCLHIAQEVWNKAGEKNPAQRIGLATELFLTTRQKQYSDFLLANEAAIVQTISNNGWIVGRAVPLINDHHFTENLGQAVKILYDTIKSQGERTPYGVPYQPNIWGAGWDIQRFGFRQYFLHKAFPEIVSEKYMLAAMNFILGCHPGSNTASFASGVGASSAIPGYGFNRADWSYIPGGIVSGTALIRPDFPELLSFPYLWQQGEYVLGGGTTDYLFLVLAANNELSAR